MSHFHPSEEKYKRVGMEISARRFERRLIRLSTPSSFREMCVRSNFPRNFLDFRRSKYRFLEITPRVVVRSAPNHRRSTCYDLCKFIKLVGWSSGSSSGLWTPKRHFFRSRNQESKSSKSGVLDVTPRVEVPATSNHLQSTSNDLC